MEKINYIKNKIMLFYYNNPVIFNYKYLYVKYNIYNFIYK